VVPVIIDEEHPEDCEFLSVHVGGAYATPWGISRNTLYPGSGTPYFWADGMIYFLGVYYPNAAATINAWNSRINARLAVPTDVTIEITPTDVNLPDATFEANICMEAGGTDTDVRVHMVNVLDQYPHYGSFNGRNTVREGFAVGDFMLKAGECFAATQTFTFDSTSLAQLDDIRIVAFVQEPLSTAPAEVSQAAGIWPFRMEFSDSFESGDFTAWSAAYPGP
jgi:hypothetical protein